MSFIAKLKLDGDELNVLHCSYRFTQMTDATGRPTALPQGGSIDLVVESNGTSDLFDWMVHPTQVKSGAITFFRHDNVGKSALLEFADAYCIDYHESFDHKGENAMQVRFTISALEIKFNGSPFKNNWPK